MREDNRYFPTPYNAVSLGPTVRDEIAIRMAAAIVASCGGSDWQELDDSGIAFRAYELADALIAESQVKRA